MRILGFSKKWLKLNPDKPVAERPKFTTFRFERKDKPHFVGEQMQIVIQPRRKGGGEKLGIAEIIKKEPRNMVKILADERIIPTVSEAEAKDDGFENYWDMWHWLFDTYHGGQRFIDEPMNKLTLEWCKEK